MKLILLSIIFSMFLFNPNSSSALDLTTNLEDFVNVTDYNSTEFAQAWLREEGYSIALERLPPDEKTEVIFSIAEQFAPCETILKDYLTLGNEERKRVYGIWYDCADERFVSNPTNFILFQLVIGLINENEEQTTTIDNLKNEAITQTYLAIGGVAIGIAGFVFGTITYFKRK